MAGKKKQKKATEVSMFLNVDLQITSKQCLGVLGSYFETCPDGFVLFCGRIGRKYFCSIESEIEWKNPDQCISALCAILKKLPRALKVLVKGAESVVFDIGYDLMGHERSLNVKLKPESLARVSKVRGTLAFTVYNDVQMSKAPVTPVIPPIPPE